MLLVTSRKQFRDAFHAPTLRKAVTAASVNDALTLAGQKTFSVILVDQDDTGNAEFVAGLLAKAAIGSPLILVGSNGFTRPVTSEERFIGFMDNLPGHAFIKDADGRYCYVNRAFLEDFQGTPTTVIGKTDTDLLPPDLAALCLNSDQIVLQEHRVHQTLESFVVNGRTTHLLVTKFPLGQSGMIGGMAVDITAQKEIEAELARAKDAAIAASESKSSFVAQISHEIRTPLNAIVGFADLLDTPTVAESEKMQYLEIIRRNGRELSRLVDDILDLSKIEANRLEMQHKTASVTDILNDVSSSLSQMANDKGIKFDIILTSDAPKTLHTDPARLRQILLNICGNAIKFTDNGSVTITATHPTDDGLARFIIRDTGEGIAIDQQSKLFQPFSQACTSSARGGTGLGLALSRHLARALGGDVVLVDTATGRGSTFAVSVAQGEIKAATSAPSAPVKSTEPDSHQRLDGLRVLVADDSKETLLLVDRILHRAGAKVVTADNGKDAVDKALNAAFDVILMDVQMPIMDGYHAAKELRRHGYKQPIIALTAHAMQSEQYECFSSGFDRLVTKPFTRTSLLAALATRDHQRPSMH